MKRILFICPVLFLIFSGCENLIYNEFNPKNASVAEAKGSRDGTHVRITGTIDSHLIGEWYTFSDNTGSITVEIENEIWARLGINPSSLQLPAPFEITGEVEKERNQNTIIEVDRLIQL